MSEIIKLHKPDISRFGFILSVLLHAALFAGAVFLYQVSPSVSGGGGGYVEISASDINSEGVPVSKQEVKKIIPNELDDKETKKTISDELVENVPSKLNIPEESRITGKINKSAITSSEGSSKSNVGKYRGYSANAGDTTSLQQVYSEKSLNVTINYPIGWTFLDQNKRSKLDGVTFWANDGSFNPPPYVFLEVKEKYLFNAAQFKYKTKTLNSEIYYNDPEEMEGQVSQIFYFRTKDDEDYSIKLIMNGREAFSAFQPVFFGMIKTFRFGNSFF